jgi:uncharacterized membrane protein (UPF0182 family)
MTDPQVFYNREGLWVSPNETYAGAATPMDPDYILMKLPGSARLEYLLMTPQNRDKMISRIDYHKPSSVPCSARTGAIAAGI